MFQTVVFREFNNFSSLLLPLYQLVSNVFLQKILKKYRFTNIYDKIVVFVLFSVDYISNRIALYFIYESYFFSEEDLQRFCK